MDGGSVDAGFQLTYRQSDDVTWLFIVATMVGFVFAFGIGANDVANSFGTSLGSGALTLRQAVGIAAVCEILGAVTLGAGVSDTILKKISDVKDEDCWGCGVDENNKITLFMSGMAAALCASALFLILATWKNMPVSTTHAVVGAVLGMTVIGAGPGCVLWLYPGFLQIVASWFVSPLLAGIITAILDIIVRKFVLESRTPLRRALITVPIATGGSIGSVLLMVLLKNKSLKGSMHLGAKFATGGASMVAVALVVAVIGMPVVKRSLGITKDILDAEMAGTPPLALPAPQAKSGPKMKKSRSSIQRDHEPTKAEDVDVRVPYGKHEYFDPFSCQPRRAPKVGSEKFLANLPIDLRHSINLEHLGPILPGDGHVEGESSSSESETSESGDHAHVVEEIIEEVHINEDDLAAGKVPEWAAAIAGPSSTPQGGSHPDGSSPVRSHPPALDGAGADSGDEMGRASMDSMTPEGRGAVPKGSSSRDNSLHGNAKGKLVPVHSVKFTPTSSFATGLVHNMSFDEIKAHEAALVKISNMSQVNTPEEMIVALKENPDLALPTLKELQRLQVAGPSSLVGKETSYAPSSTGGPVKRIVRRIVRRKRKGKKGKKDGGPVVPDCPMHEHLFMYLQVLTACLKSYAHGANDTSNAAGPYAAVQALYLDGPEECKAVSTPLWVLFFIGAGIVVGLSTWGYRVMNTVGKGLISINFPRGFVIELGSTFSVVLASLAEMPVSSTHCQIGSVVAIGLLQSYGKNADGAKKLDWGIFKQIVISWLVTVPFAAVVAAGLYAAFKPGVKL